MNVRPVYNVACPLCKRNAELLAAAQAQNAALQVLVEALDGLLICYRTGNIARGGVASERVRKARATLAANPAPPGEETP